MSAILEGSIRNRTESIAPPTLTTDFGTTADLHALYVGLSLMIELDESGVSAPAAQAIPFHRIALDGTMFAGSGDATSSNVPLILLTPHRTDALVSQRPKTLAESAVAEIRDLSGLMMEEIAALIGVSRRSIQSWASGTNISARKEHYLLALRDAIRRLAAANPHETRQRLLDRRPGNVCPYNLLAERRFEDAVSAATGQRRMAEEPAQSMKTDGILAQLNRHEEPIKIVPEPLNRRFSGQLKR